MTPRILIFNWHEAYIHLLAKTGYQFDVAEVNKGGNYGWINEFRPVPSSCRLISEKEADSGLKAGWYDRIICQNIDDLTMVCQYPVPKILLFHTKFSLMTKRYPDSLKNEFLEKTNNLIRMLDDITLVFISRSKMKDWGLQGEVILPGIDHREYYGYRGNIEKVLRIGNSLPPSTTTFLKEELKGIPCTVVGDNPHLTESYLPAGWEEYKGMLRSHRVYLNMLHDNDDDGYNLAMLEAMATGMPVVSVANVTSPIIDGVNGYLSADSNYLRDRLHVLLSDESLAESLGRRGRDTVLEQFPIDAFIHSWRSVIENAQPSRVSLSEHDVKDLIPCGKKNLNGHTSTSGGKSRTGHEQKYQTMFEKNISVLREAAPRLAQAVEEQKREHRLEIIYSRSDMPSVRVNNITVHSLYDPEKEAGQWVQHYRKHIDNASSLCVLGFGLGYHVLELCKYTDKDIVVFEPWIEMLRSALKTMDLTSVLSRVRIITDDEMPSWTGKIAILEQKASVSLNNVFFENVRTRLKSRERMKKGLRILVVGPIYGGSLPIAKYCSSSLIKMGHTVEFVDSSRFDDTLFFARDITTDTVRYNRLVDLLSSFISEAVIARCEAFKPDLVFALAQAPLSSDCLEKLKQHNVPTAYWFVEDFRFMEYWKKIASYYDYFFTIQKEEFFTALDKAGIQHYYYLPLAASPHIHRPEKLSEEEKNYYGSDLSFVGAGYYNRRRFLKGLLDFDLKIWGTDWDMNSALATCVQRSGTRIDTDEIVKIFRATKININLHSSTYHIGIDPFGEFVNPRTFEIIACGGFQLVDRRTGLHGLLKENEEIVVFDDLDDLRDKITYYLRNPEKREEIIEKGMQRIAQEHTYENRMHEMLNFISEKGFEPPVWLDDGEDVDTLIKEAGEDTELGKYLSRFSDRRKVTLPDIADEISHGEGHISETEALFLAMNEFVQQET